MAIDFSSKCEILSELWMNYRADEDFGDFIEYNDLGLPMAYMVHSSLVTPLDEARVLIEETYSLLINALNVPEDNDFTTLNELFKAASEE